MEEFTFIVASWGIRARWRKIRRFVLEFKASYFFLNSYIWCFLFEKSNLRVQRNSTLNLERKEVCAQFLEDLGFPIHFSVIRQYQNYWKCMEKLRFSKNWSRTSLHFRISELFELASYSFQRESNKYEFRKNRSFALRGHVTSFLWKWK